MKQWSLGNKSRSNPTVKGGARLRTKLEEIFSSRLEVADGALEHRDLCHGIAGGFQFRTYLVFEVRGVADAVDQEVEKPLDWEETLGFEFFQGLITDRDVAVSHVEDHIVVAVFSDTLEP
jgi:hypothetical protein